LREISKPGVIKELMGWIFLLIFTLLFGKWRLNNIKYFSEKLLKAMLGQFDSRTSSQLWLERAALKFALLSTLKLRTFKLKFKLEKVMK